MNNRAFVVSTTTVILIIMGLVGGGLWGANASGLLGLAKQGEACGLPLPKPCADGTICSEGICVPTVGGGLDRWLYSISLTNILCRGNLFANVSCNLIVNLAGAVIIGLLAVLLALIYLRHLPLVLATGVFLFGAIIGFVIGTIVNYFWWLIIILLIVLTYLAFRMGAFE